MAGTWVFLERFLICLTIQQSLHFAGEDADEILEYLMEKDIDVRDVMEEDGQIIVYGEVADFHSIKKH